MAKVSINIIKDWFRNQQKPPQEQFWAWLDSFWHKDEPIPQSAVENLVPDLQKKADLVEGVIPENQLPFSVVTSERIALGSVTIDGDKVNLPVHSSGANTVRVKGRTITRTFPNQWTFTPIADNGVKVLRGYAVKTEDDFFLAEGPELPEYEQPEIPADALELFEFTVTSEGATLIEQDLTAYKLKANDAWVRTWVNYTTDIQTLSIHHAALRFIVRAGHDLVKIGGFNFYKPEFLYDGVEITLRNETLGELELATVAASGNTIPINPADLPVNLKIGESCTLAYDAYANVFNVQKMGSEADLSGYATTEELGLKLDKPTAPNNIPARVVNADNSTSDKGEFQLSEQIEIATSQPAQASWMGKLLIINASCTMTIPNPATLPACWNVCIYVRTGALTPAITSPGEWIGTAPAAAPADSFFYVLRIGNTNFFKVLGL